MKLPLLKFGREDRNPVVLVHGLFGQGRNLAGVARSLSEHRFVLSVDLRNHGTADWSDVHDYPSMAADLYETLTSYDKVDMLGHSMGGKAAMMFAMRWPDKIQKLAVGDIAPVKYEHSQLDYILSMKKIDLTKLESRSQAFEALSQEIPDKGICAFLLHSLNLKGEAPSWQINLEALEKNMQAIVDWPKQKNRFLGETLFLAGENSDYIKSSYRSEIENYFPSARIIKIKNAGHWLHVDQPKVFSHFVVNFFGT